MTKISPSILASDLSNLEKEIKKVEDHVDYIHIDVMDGHFVPNLTFGFPIARAVKRVTNVPMDVHLMVTNPMDLIDGFLEIGVGVISVHYEVCHNLYMAVSRIREGGARAFVAINIQTPVLVLEDILPYIDGVLIMSVNPGFSGQTFLDRAVDKVRRLRLIANELKPDLDISVDGGVNLQNAPVLVENGASMLVMGSAVFSSEHPEKICEEVRKL